MSWFEVFGEEGRKAGCPPEQVNNFLRAGIVLQPRQLAASAAARLSDPGGAGPWRWGYGGARGGGKKPLVARADGGLMTASGWRA